MTGIGLRASSCWVHVLVEELLRRQINDGQWGEVTSPFCNCNVMGAAGVTQCHVWLYIRSHHVDPSTECLYHLHT